jgi:hypothetical protein
MRSDPGYFRLNSEKFKDVDIFKKKRLSEIIDEDEKLKDLIKESKELVKKTSRFNLKE